MTTIGIVIFCVGAGIGLFLGVPLGRMIERVRPRGDKEKTKK